MNIGYRQHPRLCEGVEIAFCQLGYVVRIYC